VFVELHDGRIVGFPADRFRILARATMSNWPESAWSWTDMRSGGELDEDLTVPGVVAGRFSCPEMKPNHSVRRTAAPCSAEAGSRSGWSFSADVFRRRSLT